MSATQETTTSESTGAVVKHDLLASVVVFLVALPLCMGIAIASGAPVAAGLITGIVGGIVVGLLAGSPLQVSGPAAGLTVIVYQAIQTHGIEMLGLIVLIAGALQLAAGTARLAQWFRAVSPAVIKGMLTGIGVLIFASQFHVMVDDKPKGSGLQNLASIPQAIQKGLSVPEFGSREQRQFRTQALKQIGNLHRQQVELETRVAELLPDHASAEKLARRSQERQQADAEALRGLREQQARISEEVRAILAGLEQHNPQDNIQWAVSAALEAGANAEADLRNGHAARAVETQRAATRELSDLLDRLKTHSLAAEIGVLTILLILAWQALAPKRIRVVPAPLIAVLAATAVAATLYLPVLYVEVPDRPLASLHVPTLAMLQDAPWPGILQSALVIAVVASAETLLCAVAVDQMHTGPRTKFDKELAAQGIGNMVCGFLGALPMTGVIVRSAANVQAGGRTRCSAVLHGVWLLVFVGWLSFLLRLVPTSALAAILVYTGYKLINPKVVKELWQYGKGEVAIYAATVGVIVGKDLLAGVLTGVVLSAIKLLYTFSHLKVRITYEDEGHKAALSLHGAATFIRLPKLAERLEQIPANTELHVDLARLDYIDHACLDLLMSWARQHEATGGKLVIDWDSMHARFRRDPAERADMSRVRKTA